MHHNVNAGYQLPTGRIRVSADSRNDNDVLASYNTGFNVVPKLATYIFSTLAVNISKIPIV